MQNYSLFNNTNNIFFNFRVVSSKSRSDAVSFVLSEKLGLSTSVLHTKRSHQIIYLLSIYRAMHNTKEVTEIKKSVGIKNVNPLVSQRRYLYGKKGKNNRLRN